MSLRAYLASILADYSPEERSTAMFELYKDGNGDWRWRLLANNKKVIADSGEGYRKRSECHKAVDRVRRLVACAAVIEVLHKPDEQDGQ
jgi:uncharacterized protein YegP (UPF0339 family)